MRPGIKRGRNDPGGIFTALAVKDLAAARTLYDKPGCAALPCDGAILIDQRC